jgi:hypothetical protein
MIKLDKSDINKFAEAMDDVILEEIE